MKRREFTKLLSVSAVAAALPGCCILFPKEPELIFSRYQNDDLKNPLIDTHAHFFNGSDLPVKDFIDRVAKDSLGEWAFLAGIVAPWIQRLFWWLAPTAEDELGKLNDLKSKGIKAIELGMAATTEIQFQKAKVEVKAAIERVKNEVENNLLILEQTESDSIDYTTAILDSEDYASYSSMQSSYSSTNVPVFGSLDMNTMISIRGGLRFAIEMFQYRTTSAINYLKTYGRDGTKFNHLIHHIVDYDWWLSKGRETKSNISSQIECFSEIKKVSNNLLEYFVPFCPLRQAIWNKAKREGKDANKIAGFNPIEYVTDAIKNKGASGVKIYPPMGFSLFNNRQLQENNSELWAKKDYLPSICKDTDFGEQLDIALDELYSTCQKNSKGIDSKGIPIMLHSRASNLTHKDFKVVFDTEFWRPLFSKYRLKINFGHFGGFDCLSSKCDPQSTPWKALFKIMSEQKQLKHSELYADTGFFSEALNNPEALVERFKLLLKDDSSVASENILFGSDWKMLLTDNNSHRYLTEFKSLLKKLMNEGRGSMHIYKNIIGRNANRFLRR